MTAGQHLAARNMSQVPNGSAPNQTQKVANVPHSIPTSVPQNTIQNIKVEPNYQVQGHPQQTQMRQMPTNITQMNQQPNVSQPMSVQVR